MYRHMPDREQVQLEQLEQEDPQVREFQAKTYQTIQGVVITKCTTLLPAE